MSKYIRTNEGIYELKENMTIETGIFSFFGKIYNTSEKHLFRNDKDLGEFVSQADTIKELCDKFVITFNDKSIEPKQFKIFETALEELNKCDNKYCPVLKGAIWTDKGLIYVSKLNEKGDSELI